MSTRSLICYKNTDGQYPSIYCHFDGFDGGSGVGAQLRAHFNSPEKVKDLVALGDLSYIEQDTVVAYHRDREEDWDLVKPKEFTSLEELVDAGLRWGVDNVFLFMFGKWVTIPLLAPPSKTWIDQFLAGVEAS